MSMFEVAAILAAVADTWTTDRVIAAGGREAWPLTKYLAHWLMRLTSMTHRKAVLIVGASGRVAWLGFAHAFDPGGTESAVGWSLTALAFATAAVLNYRKRRS